MNTSMIIMLAGGLGLFLYGMKMMGDGLEQAAGSRLKRLLEILTENRLMGLLVGAIVTAIIQSSSATTVMVVGFVNAGIMTLGQAVGVIMGANIGTTMTAFLISLNLTDIAPIIVFIGVGLVFFSKRKTVKSIGEILVGFGILFIGMGFMSDAMKPLRSNEGFQRILISMSHPILGVLAGTIMTVILQSSSASVGILQALAAQGLIGLDSSLPILFGMNIGTCITAILASIGTSVNAKRTAFMHLSIKVIGTSIFMLAIALGVPFVDLILRISPSNPMSQIANAHIAFNVITAAILLPFGNSIVSLSKKVLHGMNGKPDERGLIYLDKHILETPPIAIAQILKEVNRMADLAVENVRLAMDAFFQREQAIIDEVYKKEEIINFLNQEITHYLVMCNGLGLPESDLHVISGLYHVVNDIERIGDHAENLTEYAEYSIENNLTFSDIAIDDLNEMYQKVMEMLDDTVHALKERDHELAELVMKEEEVIDILKDRLRKSHIERLNAQLCSANAGVIFLDIVTNFERIADHATNVAQSVLDEGRTRNY
ncbi:MAG TPA: Na/Pi cotransporter family protein [Clostridiales bacterium]|jgi:phosphate:Na+ symporter|nr:Na/Pi cotransporter family protein [Clostridiales bacterium]